MRHTNATQRTVAGITPPLFTFLDAQPNGPLLFAASSPDGGYAQIAGRGDMWCAALGSETDTASIPGVYPTPASAAEAVARHVEVLPYSHAEAYYSQRERLVRQRVARGDVGKTYSYHTPPPPTGFTLSEDWSGSKYRFYADAEGGTATAVVSGAATRWVAAVTDGTNSDYYEAAWINPEEAATALTAASVELAKWRHTEAQALAYPDTIPLIDDHGDTLWVVDRDYYYRLGDQRLHSQAARARDRSRSYGGVGL